MWDGARPTFVSDVHCQGYILWTSALQSGGLAKLGLNVKLTNLVLVGYGTPEVVKRCQVVISKDNVYQI
jgi:hypothetical protein